MNFYEELIRDTAPDRDYLLASPVIQRCLDGDITRDLYVAFLTQAYHHVRHTVPLLMAVGARLPDRQAWLRESVLHYLEEEAGAAPRHPDRVRHAGGTLGARQSTGGTAGMAGGSHQRGGPANRTEPRLPRAPENRAGHWARRVGSRSGADQRVLCARRSDSVPSRWSDRRRTARIQSPPSRLTAIDRRRAATRPLDTMLDSVPRRRRSPGSVRLRAPHW